MTITYENESVLDLGIPAEETARLVTEETMRVLGCPYEVSVNILLTDEEEIHKLNLEYRQVDRPTDVLSFPMSDFPAPGDFSFLDEDSPDTFDPDTGELMLGDIVLCAGRVLSQAEEYGHSVRREFAFLVTHSLLHLTGFDHMTEEEAAEMEGKQRQILDSLGITR